MQDMACWTRWRQCQRLKPHASKVDGNQFLGTGQLMLPRQRYSSSERIMDLIQLSSLSKSPLGGWITGSIFLPRYHASGPGQVRTFFWTTAYDSKFALEGFTESVAKEIGQMAGVNFLIAEPNGMKTKFAESALETIIDRHPVYDKSDNPLNFLIGYIAKLKSWESWSDPDQCAAVLFNCVVRQKKRSMPKRLWSRYYRLDSE